MSEKKDGCEVCAIKFNLMEKSFADKCKILDRLWEDRLLSIGKVTDTRFEAQKVAVDIALVDLNRRLEGMNEFRAQIQNERGSFLLKETYDSRHQLLESQINLQGAEHSKFVIKEAYDTKHQLIDVRIDSLAKLVYIGIGITLTLEFVFKFAVK